jgi:hypothetical protein
MSNVVPIPSRLPLFAEPAGRPGEWWEPLHGHAASIVAHLGTEAQRRRVPVDLLATILVERALICGDIAACAIEPLQAQRVLDAAAVPGAALGPRHLNTAYVRMLHVGDTAFELESELQLARRDLLLPLRLHEAAVALPLDEITATADVDEAVRWEVAASATGQFMREWALCALLAALAG